MGQRHGEMSDITPSGAVTSLSSGTGMLIAKGVEKREDVDQSAIGARYTEHDLRRFLARLATAVVLSCD